MASVTSTASIGRLSDSVSVSPISLYIKILSQFFDVGTDLYNGISLILAKPISHPIFGGITIGFVWAPAIFYILISLYIEKDNFKKLIMIIFCLVFAPFVPICTGILLFLKNTTHRRNLVMFVALSEASLEAALQVKDNLDLIV